MITIRLSHSATEDGAADDLVAWRAGRPLQRGELRRQIAGVAHRYTEIRAAALVCEDSFTFLAGFFGLLHAGARVVLPLSTEKGVLATLSDSFDTVLTDTDIQAAADHGGNAVLPLDPEARQIDFFTSGSTGAPKRIPKSLAMFAREAALLEEAFGAEIPPGQVFATVPHQHMFGLPFKLMWPLASGRPFVAETYGLWEPLLADLTAGAMLISSPAHLNRIAGLEPLAAAHRPARIFTAGAPLPLASSLQAEEILGVRPTEIFGSSETGAFATRTQTTGVEPWRLLPGVAIRCDETGKLAVSTPVVGTEWIEMADVVVPVEGGFQYRGRADRIVKVEGKRVNLINVEDALRTLPRIQTAAVVALQNPLRIGAAVTLSNAGQEDLRRLGAFRLGRALRQDLHGRIDPAGLPRQWRFVEALPTHVLGKRRDSDIVALFEAPR